MNRAIYKGLLWLHPASFRNRFADEMLWIFDETGEQAGLRVFTDALVSLVRQWTFHSSVWRIAFGALVSCLLLAGWWHFQEAALASALGRGNPGALEEIKHRFAKGIPCGNTPASRVAAAETGHAPALPALVATSWLENAALFPALLYARWVSPNDGAGRAP